MQSKNKVAKTKVSASGAVGKGPRPHATSLDSNDTPWLGFPLVVRTSLTGVLRNFVSPIPTVSMISGGESKVRVEYDGNSIAGSFYPGNMCYSPAGFALDRSAWSGRCESTNILITEERWRSFKSIKHSTKFKLPSDPGFCFRDLELESLIRTMRLEIENGCRSGPVFAEAISTAVLARVAAEPWKEIQPEGRARRLTAWQERRVREFIATHLSDDLHLANLASLLETSAGHFSMLFRNTFGVPPYKFVIERRIDEVKRLMATTDLSLMEIALKLRFASPSHLSTTFKRIAGITPRQFLAQI
jgi:AraC family transcriptional regulator